MWRFESSHQSTETGSNPICPASQNHLWARLCMNPDTSGDALRTKGGWISVPQVPGLGLDPDADVIKAYRWN